MRLYRATSLAATAALLTLLPTTASTAAGPVQLGRIQYSPPGPDLPVTNAKLNGEYVQIRNASGSTISLTDWTLRDTTRRPDHVYRFGTFRLAPRTAVVVHTGTGRNGPGHLYWGRTGTSGFAYVWNNTGDVAYLRNARGTLVDTCRWPAGAGAIAC